MTFRRFARGADPHRAGCIRVRSGARGLPLARKSMESCELPVRELGSRTRMRRAAVAMTALALLAGAGASVADDSRAVEDRAGAYGGVFAGSGRMGNRLIDVDGFANWGNPGSVVDYDDNRAVGGALVGRKFELDGTRLRIELDATFGYLSASSNMLDPAGLDETVETDVRWLATARVGVEDSIGPATVFATAGLATARIDRSVTDIDFGPNMPDRVDPDDSFNDRSTEFGWVIGAGIEYPLTGAWTLRLDGSYVDFGRSTHHVNRSGDNRCCGAGTPRRPVSYDISNRLGIVRAAIVYRFGR